MVLAPPSEANSAEAIFTSDGKIEVNKLSALSRLSAIASLAEYPWFDAVWLLWKHELLCRMRMT